MVPKYFLASCIFACCLTSTSCTKLGAPTVPDGPLTWETTKFENAIPQDYGQLIGLTQNPQSSGWVGLWFQRSDGTIAAVFVNTQEGRFYGKVLTIPRK